MPEADEAYSLSLYHVAGLGDGYADQAVYIFYSDVLQRPCQNVHSCDLFWKMRRVLNGFIWCHK